MSIEKITNTVVERLAPERGPTSSKDYNSTQKEIINAFSAFSTSWNDQLYPLLSTLPSGDTNINAEDRTTEINPYVNGFDGSQIYTDLTSSPFVDEGKYYEEDLDRPLTVKETFQQFDSDMTEMNNTLSGRISNLESSVALTYSQKQAIGIRIFEPSQTSSPLSLDGRLITVQADVNQIGQDIYGDVSALNHDGLQTLQWTILEQLEAIMDAHDYDPLNNTLDHDNLGAGSGGAGSLQDAYDGGAVITTTTARPVSISSPVGSNALVVNGSVQLNSMVSEIAGFQFNQQNTEPGDTAPTNLDTKLYVNRLNDLIFKKTAIPTGGSDPTIGGDRTRIISLSSVFTGRVPIVNSGAPTYIPDFEFDGNITSSVQIRFISKRYSDNLGIMETRVSTFDLALVWDLPTASWKGYQLNYQAPSGPYMDITFDVDTLISTNLASVAYTAGIMPGVYNPDSSLDYSCSVIRSVLS